MLKLRLDAETGNEWVQSVRECGPGEEADFTAVSVDGILDDSGFDRIAILKMDIEGAESVVFTGRYREWLSRVDNMVIELHFTSPFGGTHDAFRRAMEGSGFAFTESGELTVCRRPAANGHGGR
jgi:Methyltransferase FkbM domain